ncbi:ABC transporter permease [Flavihumibacter fluvii]|uniref:ABC transporter permease n=1 Tax=Flavihumibacter fluvii TaxID=2838157 RepID=UPI001BDE0B02|nr:ABC transporter permease [Flavihumibacter fluvii]ULQ52391.1 ABC transporter permease [Flavihumibacter fluvii]
MTTEQIKFNPEADIAGNSEWTTVIQPKRGWLDIDLKEIWRYRDLLMLLVKRDFVAFYKQTILGPVWFFIQPLLTTLMFLVVFGRIARLSTDGVPPILFYLAGVTCWSYISECLTKTSDTFITNANIFGKVYFPRVVIPAAVVISNLVRFSIQLCLFLSVWVYYLTRTGSTIHPNRMILLVPFLVLIMALLSLGLGIIFSSLTTKYRDLRFLLTFGIQLLMYATPVVYPLSLTSEKYRWLILANPFSALVETFRYAFTGSGTFSWYNLGYSALCMLVILATGIIIFNKVERTFMDTV